MGLGHHDHRGPGCGRRRGHVRFPGGGAAARRGDRPDLLHRGLGAAACRRAAPVPPAARALRHHLGTRPGAAGAGHRGRATYRLRRVRHGQGGDRGAAAPRDAGGWCPRDRAAPGPHQRAGLAGHHPGGQPGSRGLDAAGHRPAARAARSRAWRAEPRTRRRRGAGIRACAVPAVRGRGKLPRGGRAGDDAARPGGRRRGLVRP